MLAKDKDCKDCEGMATDKFIEIMRSKMYWLSGFSSAIQNNGLTTVVESIRGLLNKLETDYILKQEDNK